MNRLHKLANKEYVYQHNADSQRPAGINPGDGKPAPAIAVRGEFGIYYVADWIIKREIIKELQRYA